MPDKGVNEQDLVRVLNNLDGKMLLAIAVKANELLEARTDSTLKQILLEASGLQDSRVSVDTGLTIIEAEATAWEPALGFVQTVSRHAVHGGIPLQVSMATVEPTRKEVRMVLELVIAKVPEELHRAGKEGIRVLDALNLFSTKPDDNEP